jgi:hypothetical protein
LRFASRRKTIFRLVLGPNISPINNVKSRNEDIIALFEEFSREVQGEVVLRRGVSRIRHILVE